jgi:acyl-CoA thioesterase FadM
MARIKLDFPEKVIFTTTMNVRITDINYGGHLGNDALLSMIHEARVRFFNSMNANEINFFNTSVIMGDVAIQYKGESFYNDELLFEIAVNDLSAKSFDIWYKVTKHGNPIAVAKTGMVCFNYKERKTENVPSPFVEIINSNLQ